MDIRAYRHRYRVTQAALAERLGVSPGLIYQWERGLTRVTGERAIAIEAVTGGAVTRGELRPDLWPAREPVTCSRECAAA